MKICLGSKSKAPCALCMRITNSVLHIINPRACSESQIIWVSKEMRRTILPLTIFISTLACLYFSIKRGHRRICKSLYTVWAQSELVLYSLGIAPPNIRAHPAMRDHGGCPTALKFNPVGLSTSSNGFSSSCWCSRSSKPLCMPIVETCSQENIYHPLVCTKELFYSLKRNCKTHLV